MTTTNLAITLWLIMIQVCGYRMTVIAIMATINNPKSAFPWHLITKVKRWMQKPTARVVLFFVWPVLILPVLYKRG